MMHASPTKASCLIDMGPLSFQRSMRLSQVPGGCQARARGIHLLKKNLSPTQRDHYEKFGHFHVTGGTTGKRYRIRNGHQMNVEQLDKNGNLVSLWCFMPKGGLVDGDVMLAQKLALELFEPDALSVANKISAKYSLLSPMP